MFKVLLFLKLCNYAGGIDDEAEPEMIMRDYELDVNAVLFGDIVRLDDLFLQPGGQLKKKEPPITESLDLEDLPFDIDEGHIKVEIPSFDVSEFNELTKSVNNITRRYKGWFHGHNDEEDKGKKLEPIKRDKISNITLQFLIHARYHVKKAIVQKADFRLDIRYKMGYLFNRLRRIRYEQWKLVSTIGHELRNRNWKELMNTLRVYEKIVRYDVDLKDTVLLIKSLHKKESSAKDAAFSASGRTTPL